MDETEIAIVGAGPAGLQAAITAAKQGYRPILFEEHSEIGKPVQCGEGMSLNAFKDFSIPTKNTDYCVREHKQCQLVFPTNKIVYGDIHAFMIKRDKFDQFLAHKADDFDVIIKRNAKVVNIERDSDSIRLKTDEHLSNTYQTKFLLLAEGARARLANQLKFPSTPLIKAFEYKIEGQWGENLEFYFDAVKYPFGYCWIFPRDNETNIGIVTTAKQMKTRLDIFLRKMKIEGRIIQKVGGVIPMRGAKETLIKENIALVGDAAGMVNPIFYGGIRIGMTSGRIAGQVAAEYLDAIEKDKEYSTNQYYKYLNKFQFMKEVNLKCHDFFYNTPNSYLSKIGKTFDKKSINELIGLEKLKVFINLLKSPSLLKYPKGLMQIYQGFKIARDWGF